MTEEDKRTVLRVIHSEVAEMTGRLSGIINFAGVLGIPLPREMGEAMTAMEALMRHLRPSTLPNFKTLQHDAKN